jgi:hypothetical protein
MENRRESDFSKLEKKRRVKVLALEVTPGLLVGAEPDTHQFNVTICL